MMYSLLSLTLMLAASNAQTTAAPVTTAAAVAPQTTAASAATTTSSPATNQVATPQVVTPVPPTNSGPNPGSNPNPITPVRPQVPPATPQFQQPPQYNPYQQQYNPYFAHQAGILDPSTLDCQFGYCRFRKITLSPDQGFVLKCDQPRVCDGLDLTLNVGMEPGNWGSFNLVNEINDLTFNAPQNGVSVTINSAMGGHGIEVNNIKCETFGACNNLKITAGFGVETWNINVYCQVPGACAGCTINGQDCNMISAMHGNNNGYFGFGGFGYGGYQNQPAVPGQAQGAPAQQQQAPAYPQFNPFYNPWI